MKTFYVLIPVEPAAFHTNFYTDNIILLRKFLVQQQKVQDTEYEIYEYNANTPAELSDMLLNTPHQINYDDDELRVFRSMNNLEYILSNAYLEGLDCFNSLNNMIRELAAAWMNLRTLSKYINPNIKDIYDKYMVLLYKYIVRLTLFTECDLCEELKYEDKIILGFDPFHYIDVDDIYDEIYLLLVEIGALL